MLGGSWLPGLRASTSSTTILTRPIGRTGSSSCIGERRDDQWFNSNLARQDAARKIGVGNSLTEEEKSLISPNRSWRLRITRRRRRSVRRSEASATFSLLLGAARWSQRGSAPLRRRPPLRADAVG
jgi:hypothetical protein